MNDSTYFILFRSYLIRSTNYGLDWSNVNSSIPWKSLNSYHRIVDIEKNNQVLYLLTEDDNSYIKYSSNLGNSWEAVYAMDYISKTTNDLIVKNQNNIMVIGGDWDEEIQSWHDSVFVSTNAGSNWSMTDASLIPTHHKGIYCENNGFLIYNSPQYVYHIADIKQQSQNIGGDRFDDTLFFMFDDAIYIGKSKIVLVDKYNGNVWLYTFPNSSIAESLDAYAISISPNPAGDYIEISSTSNKNGLGGASNDITIYNTLGERVLTTPLLLCDATPPKEGNIRINISTLPRGIYFVKAGGETAKFVKM